MKCLCGLYGMKKSRMTPYHGQGNEQYELCSEQVLRYVYRIYVERGKGGTVIRPLLCSLSQANILSTRSHSLKQIESFYRCVTLVEEKLGQQEILIPNQ